VLPGRTHPAMTSRGGAEGYLWTAARVIPAEGKISARGKYAKKRTDNASKSEQSEEKEKQIKVEDETAQLDNGDLEMKQL